MQLIFDFSQWTISPRQGIVGRQYDNLSHSLVVEGELPSGYTWDMLVEAKGKYNVIPLSLTDTGASAVLTADQLAFGDTYYAFQLRGTSGSVIHHTNAVQVYVPDTVVGPGTWPVLPTEFSQAEADIKELNAHPPVPGANGFWLLWDLDTHEYVQSDLPLPNVGEGGGLAIYSLDDTLNLSPEGRLSVNTANDAQQDNTLPITSAAVFAEIGNIDALLATI